MAGLLEIADVDQNDGQWKHSAEVDALACGRSFRNTDRCTPSNPPVVSQAGTTFDVVPFVVLGAQRFTTRCTPEQAESELYQAVENASEVQVAKVFWDGPTAVPQATGTWPGDIWMHAPEIDSVTVGATTADTVADVLVKAYTNHPDMPSPILHLGFLSALKLGDALWNLDLQNVVVSPGYPKDAVAVTGPIEITLGPVEKLAGVNRDSNVRYVEGFRFAAVSFDPCLAVRAGT